jgi:hypothetical protein
MSVGRYLAARRIAINGNMRDIPEITNGHACGASTAAQRLRAATKGRVERCFAQYRPSRHPEKRRNVIRAECCATDDGPPEI